jgi:uncharacterized protein (DUF362 family)
VENGILLPSSDVFALGKTFAALLFVSGCSPWEKAMSQTPSWLAKEVVDLFGTDSTKRIVQMIEEMTALDEGRRISLVDDSDGAGSRSVLGHLESLRQNLK